MDDIFKCLEKTPLDKEDDYPIHHDGKCRVDATKAAVKVNNFTAVTPNKEQDLLQAIAQSPVLVGVEADKMVFEAYTGGIITSKDCGTSINHMLLAVGYGTESGQNYYLL